MIIVFNQSFIDSIKGRAAGGGGREGVSLAEITYEINYPIQFTLMKPKINQLGED